MQTSLKGDVPVGRGRLRFPASFPPCEAKQGVDARRRSNNRSVVVRVALIAATVGLWALGIFLPCRPARDRMRPSDRRLRGQRTLARQSPWSTSGSSTTRASDWPRRSAWTISTPIERVALSSTPTPSPARHRRRQALRGLPVADARPDLPTACCHQRRADVGRRPSATGSRLPRTNDGYPPSPCRGDGRAPASDAGTAGRG